MTLGARLAACEARLTMRSTVDAKDYDATGGGDHKQSMEPPGAWDDELTATGMGVVVALLRPVENAIVDLERVLDFDDGFAEGRDTTTMIAEEKDVVLVERWAGVEPDVVARSAPYLGSRRAIELARRRMGLNPATGIA
jgi:hypothetical protein